MIVPILSVKNVDTSLAFYNEKLGFTTDMVFAGPDGINTFAGIRMGAAVAFMLSRADTPHAGNGVVFMVYLPDGTDIDTVYADVQAKGVAITEALKTEYWGDRVFTITDPDGFIITISKTVEQTDMEHVAKVMSGEIEA